VSSAPQLTYARELYALQDHVGSVLTDRVRQRPGAQGGDPRDHHRLAWPDQRHEHTHGAPEVRVLLSGQARYVLRAPVLGGWAVLVCEPGDWLALPAGLPHSFEASPTQGVDLLRLHVQAGAWEAERTAALLPQALVRWREAAPDEGLALAA
jgi:1,2-dihydroxy-3-keto-5-methylthiopentene dioxygenase